MKEILVAIQDLCRAESMTFSRFFWFEGSRPQTVLMRPKPVTARRRTRAARKGLFISQVNISSNAEGTDRRSTSCLDGTASSGSIRSEERGVAAGGGLR